MLVAKYAHQRIRKPAAKSAERLDGNRNRDRSFYHQIAGAFTGKIQDGSLTGKKSSFGRRNDGRESRISPGFDTFVGKANFIGRTAPRGGVGTIFGTVRDFGRPSRCTFCRRRRSGRRNSYVGKRVNQARIDGESLAFDDPRVGGNRRVLCDSHNHAACYHDGGVVDCGAGDRHHSRATDREVLRLATLGKRGGRSDERAVTSADSQ